MRAKKKMGGQVVHVATCGLKNQTTPSCASLVAHKAINAQIALAKRP